MRLLDFQEAGVRMGEASTGPRMCPVLVVRNFMLGCIFLQIDSKVELDRSSCVHPKVSHGHASTQLLS